MDIIEPCLVWVNGGCYRFFESNIWSNEDFSGKFPVEINCNSQRIDRLDDDQEFDDPDDQELYDDYNREFYDDNREFYDDNREFHDDNREFHDDNRKFDDSRDYSVVDNIDDNDDFYEKKIHEIEEEKTMDEIVVTPMPRSGYIHTCIINKRFFPIIVGRSGAVKQKLEIATNTSITVPRAHEGEQVEIKGADRENVISARRELDAIIKNARRFIKDEEILATASNNNIETWNVGNAVKTQSYTTSPNTGMKNMNGTYGAGTTTNAQSRMKNSVDGSSAKFKSNPVTDRRIDDSIPPWISSVKKTYTHFISIPMTSDVVKKNFLEFTNALVESSSDHRGIRREIFRNPKKLHITLGMLSLRDERALKAASTALENCKKTIIDPIIAKMGPIVIRAQGLEGAFWEPYDINVLYTRLVTRNNLLQQMVDKIVHFFICTGLMDKPYREFKMQMTLMNAGFDKKNPYKKFNVKNILKEYRNYVFGESQLSEIYISKRGDYATNGYYATTAKISIP